jgi:hypothetical protein
MQSKTERIRTALANGDWLSALRMASHFHDRSNDTLIFKRGFDAYQHPDFYRQLGNGAMAGPNRPTAGTHNFNPQ